MDGMGNRVAVLAGKIVAATASVAVLASVGVAWGTYRQLQALGSSSAIPYPSTGRSGPGSSPGTAHGSWT